MPNPVVEVIIKARDLASNVVKGFERNLRSSVRLAKDVGRDLAAIGAAAVGAVVGLQRMGKAGAEVIGVKRAFAKVTGDEVAALNELRQAAGGTVSDLNLMKATNQAIALGAAQTASDVAKLVRQSRALGRALGIDGAEALDKYVVALARQSKLRLDDLGITLDVQKANEQYASSIGRSVNALNDAEKAEAFRTAAMAEADRLINQLGDSTTRGADAADRFAATVQNVKDRLFELVATSPKVAAFFDEWGMILTEMSGGGTARVQGEVFSLANASLKALSDRAEEYAHALAAASDETRTLEERNQRLAELGVTDDEARRILDYINGRIRILTALQGGAGSGGAGGGGAVAVAPRLTGARADMEGLLKGIRDSESALEKATLEQKLAAPGDAAEKAAEKVKALAEELARLKALAGQFGGVEGLILGTARIPGPSAGLLNRPDTIDPTAPFRTKRYSLVPDFVPGTERGLPFGDSLTMSPRGAASLAYSKSLEDAEGRFDKTGGAIARTMGDIGADLVRGTATIESTILNMIGNILDNVGGGGLLGGVLGGVFAIGAALFSKNDRPRVIVDDYGSDALRKMKDGDKRLIRQTFIVEQNGIPISEIERELYDRQDRDEVVRFPVGGSGYR